MPELKPKSSPEDSGEKTETKQATPEKAPDEVASVPIEVASDKGAIQIKLEGDFVELIMSQYLAEHIGQFRACKHIVIKFKVGHTPDITAIQEHGA